MNKKQIVAMEENMVRLECCFEEVVKEFAKAYAPTLPSEVRTRLMKATALRWATEELHRAVQRHYGENYELAQPVEHVNNLSRMAYHFCTEGFSDKIPSVPRIMTRQ
jgi:hypothetical protein